MMVGVYVLKMLHRIPSPTHKLSHMIPIKFTGYFIYSIKRGFYVISYVMMFLAHSFQHHFPNNWK